MTPHLIRYTIKPEHTARNDEHLGAVFAELEAVRPVGLRYAAFKLNDGVSYVHFVWMDAQHEHRPAAQLASLRAFHAGIRERCDHAPVRTELSEIGAFGLFEAA